MKKLLILCAILSLASCDILKESQKVKNDIERTESIKKELTRPADTIRLQVPKITYKDTTIFKTNYVNRTEARITYDNKGNAEIECIQSGITELTEEFRTFKDQSKEKESSKEESFQSEIILYIMLGLAVIILGAVFVFMWQMKSQSKLMTSIAQKLIT